MSKKVTKQEREEAIESLYMAKEHLIEAVEVLRKVANDLNDEHARSYIVTHLRCLVDRDHGYLSRDYTVQDWIEELEEGEEG